MSEVCQSCGMPMSEDPGQGGTFADQTKSTEYCSACLIDGQFAAAEHLTAAERRSLVRQVLHDRGVPRWLSWFLTRRIP